MSAELLTRDNPLLSRVTKADVGELSANAINSELVAGYVRDSLAENTRRAYFSDLIHFERWGGSVPASAEIVASYLATHAETLKVSTLVRRIASISKAHAARGFHNPVRSELVKSTMRGIKRSRGVAQQEAKPLIKEDLFLILAAIGETLKTRAIEHCC